MGFGGRRVLALESRRSAEMAELIRRNGGEPFVAPSMREVPLEADEATARFAAGLYAGEFDMMVLLTGVGTRQLHRLLGPPFVEALGKLTVAARGPKPVAALREMGLTAAVVAREPNTWRELLRALEGRTEKRIAVQEYGRPNPELLAELRSRGADVTAVRVYQWDLPEDAGPLFEAARRLAAGEFDAALFTTGIQMAHLARAAREQGMEDTALEALRRCFVGSIGPTTTEALEEFGVQPAFEPTHPKMGVLVMEAGQWIASV
ncbi:MAG TPA: uroporphyrinogen-III synthase [Bryobacteraceae bacterium]|jgi:uroporphyrinogen-III synthase|nr:uroporphyrinogen-III synthase [Bryobacteraceae bacterium]